MREGKKTPLPGPAFIANPFHGRDTPCRPTYDFGRYQGEKWDVNGGRPSPKGKNLLNPELLRLLFQLTLCLDPVGRRIAGKPQARPSFADKIGAQLNLLD